MTTDAEALLLEYQDRVVDVHTLLEGKPGDMNEFVVRDPHGKLILFGSPA